MPYLNAFAHPHAPNFSLLAHVSPIILIHLIFAVIAFGIGAIQIIGAQYFGMGGKTAHRILGWTWVVMMFVVAISSFFVRVINPGHFSLIHLLSILVVVMLPIMVYAARRHKVDLHRRVATRLYAGALVIAGLFTFFPGRLIWHIFFG